MCPSRPFAIRSLASKKYKNDGPLPILTAHKGLKDAHGHPLLQRTNKSTQCRARRQKKIKTVAISALAHPASHGLLVHLALANAAPARPPRRPIVRASWPDAPAATGPSCSALGELESPNDPLEPHTYHTVRVEMRAVWRVSGAKGARAWAQTLPKARVKLG